MGEGAADKFELVRIARLVLAEHLHPLEGVWQMISLGDDMLQRHPILLEVHGIASLTDHIPRCPARENFSAEYLARTDIEVPTAQILDLCRRLIRESADAS
ncbi:MAG: hypothetical protein ABL866_13915 [Devosia sp.]